MRVLGSILVVILLSALGVRCAANDRLFGLARDFKSAAGVLADGLTQVSMDSVTGQLTARSILRIPGVSVNSSIPAPLRAFLFNGNCASAHELAVYNTSEFSGEIEFNDNLNAFGAELEYEFDNQSEVFSAIMIESESGDFCSEITSRNGEELLEVKDLTYSGLSIELFKSVSGNNLSTVAVYADGNSTGIKSLTGFIISGAECEGLTNDSLDNSTYDAEVTFTSKNADGFFTAAADFEGEIDLTGDVAFVIVDGSNAIVRCELISSVSGDLATEAPLTPTKAPTNGPRGELPTEQVSASSIVAPCVSALLLALLAL